MGKAAAGKSSTQDGSNTAALTATAGGSSSSHATRDEFGPPAWAPQPLVNFARSTEFFARVAHIYGAYKLTQLRAAVMRAQGRSQQDITEQLWDGQHTWAGQQMYDLCISLRGFYLKVGGKHSSREILPRLGSPWFWRSGHKHAWWGLHLYAGCRESGLGGVWRCCNASRASADGAH
jgi:hypothetical protein